MAQTVILLLVIAAASGLVYYNQSLMQTSLTLAGPGMHATPTYLLVLGAVIGALVLLWLAGMADRAGIERRLRRQDRTLHAMGEEMLRMKSSAYDQERPPLGDIRVRLESMERDIRAIRARLAEGSVTPAKAVSVGSGRSF